MKLAPKIVANQPVASAVTLLAQTLQRIYTAGWQYLLVFCNSAVLGSFLGGYLFSFLRFICEVR